MSLVVTTFGEAGCWLKLQPARHRGSSWKYAVFAGKKRHVPWNLPFINLVPGNWSGNQTAMNRVNEQWFAAFAAMCYQNLWQNWSINMALGNRRGIIIVLGVMIVGETVCYVTTSKSKVSQRMPIIWMNGYIYENQAVQSSVKKCAGVIFAITRSWKAYEKSDILSAHFT